MSRHEIDDLQSVLEAMVDGEYYQKPSLKKKVGWTGARDGSGDKPTIPHGVRGIRNRACIEPLPNIKSK